MNNVGPFEHQEVYTQLNQFSNKDEFGQFGFTKWQFAKNILHVGNRLYFPLNLKVNLATTEGKLPKSKNNGQVVRYI